MSRKNERYYKEVFFAHNGVGPYPCFFCKEDVGFLDVLVHHKDHDHWNDVPDNLVPAHRGCHTRHHRLQQSDEERAANAERMRTRVVSEETRRKMSEARIRLGPTGPQSEETRRKKSEAVKGHWKSDPDRKSRIKRGTDGKFI